MKTILSAIFQFLLPHISKGIVYKYGFILTKPLCWILWGWRYKDPIDGKNYMFLLPYGHSTIRKNALAPHSLSLERHRLLWHYLINKTNFLDKDYKNLLHVAPEYGLRKNFKKIKNLNYYTCDLYDKTVQLNFDIQDIPFRDNYFDYIICNHVLEHVEDDIKAMKEFFRILKPNGKAFLMVPLNWSLIETKEDAMLKDQYLRKYYFGQHDHVRVYGKDYFQRLNSCGFITEVIFYGKELPDFLVKKYCLSQDDPIVIASK